MKRIGIFVLLIFSGLYLNAQTPRFTTQRAGNGLLVIAYPSEQDAMLHLGSNYNFPDHFFLMVQLRGIYLQDYTAPPGMPSGWLLGGTRLTEEGSPKKLGTLSQNYYNLNRNTDYLIVWEVQTFDWMRQLHRIAGGTGEVNPMSTVYMIADANGTPLPIVRR